MRSPASHLMLLAMLGVGSAVGCAREAAPPQSVAFAWQPVHLPERIPPAPRMGGAYYPPPGPFGVPHWAGAQAFPFVDSVHRAAVDFYLPPPLIWAVMKTESDFRPNAVSGAGALGLMQLMPKTARSLGVDNPFDAEQNIRGGCQYLRDLADRYEGDLALTLAAYNAGPATVRRHGGVPPFEETRSYIQRVLNYYWSTGGAQR